MLKSQRKLALRKQTIRELTTVQVRTARGGDVLYLRNPEPPPPPLGLMGQGPMSGDTQDPGKDPGDYLKGK